MRRFFVVSLFAAALLCATAHSGTIQGRVVEVVDGDTIVVAYRTGEFKVRIGAIDAPERAQRFGYESRKYLLTLLYGKTVQVIVHKVDSYGRWVGVVLADGVDVGLAQVQAGYAWHFKRFQDEQSPADRAAYAAAELGARDRRVGIWSVPGQIPPWDFRYRSRKGLSVVPSPHVETRMRRCQLPSSQTSEAASITKSFVPVTWRFLRETAFTFLHELMLSGPAIGERRTVPTFPTNNLRRRRAIVA